LREELGVEPVELHRLIQFRMNYGPGDNMISELYEGVIDPTGVKIDPEEIERLAYYRILELATLLDEREPAFSPWFAQLLRWYIGKPSALDPVRHPP
jgi:isopentenyldiphosphate isomerase